MNPSVPRPMNGYHPPNIASSSSNTYPEFQNANQYPNDFSIHHQHIRVPQQQEPHQLPQSQWSAPMHSNSFQSHHHQPQQHHQPQRQHPQHHQPQHQQSQHQHSNPPMWSNNSNQMPVQPFLNGNAQISAFNMPLISQQIIQDAFAMSAPVEAADEKVLLQTLLDSRNKKQTYKDALNSLHGKNGHSASLWKDYYLEHKDRLDDWIIRCMNPPKVSVQTAKKPSPALFKTENSPVLPSRAVSSRQTKRTEQSVQPSKGRRSTINSLSAPEPVYDDRLPAPNAELKVPEPPSRSPSPPTAIVPQGRGNKYTPEDRDFFLRFISWRLKYDPTLNRNDLCAQLAEKAPHHTAQSWGSYWSNHHDLPDKILAAARGEVDDDNDSKSEEDKLPIRRRPTYRESSSEEDDNDNDSDNEEDGTNEESDDDDDASIQSFSESEMGVKGGPFTDADLYVTAKYAATFPAFEEASAKERWQPYSERFPQRSAKSWTEYYRRYERQIEGLARKIRAQKNAEPSDTIRSQRARPTWASSLNSSQPKRKHDTEDAEDANSSKRGKVANNA